MEHFEGVLPRKAPDLTCKHYTRLERLARDNHMQTLDYTRKASQIQTLANIRLG